MSETKVVGVRKRPLLFSVGFTLIELLVAISILAIIAVLGWRGLDSIVRTRIALTSELENTRGMQLTFAQLQSDCENIVSRAVFNGHGDRLMVDAGRLTLVRTVLTENQPSRLEVVAYRVKDGLLTRRESGATRDITLLDVMLRATLEDTDDAPSVTLQSGVDSMHMRLWNGNAGPWRSDVEKPLQPGAAEDTGLEVGIKLQGKETGLVKIFLLGTM